MQREILFRAQRADNGEWVYGSLQHFDNGECYIKSTESNKRFGAGILINPETVGQFTGLTDKNGTKIFEGDKIHSEIHNPSVYEIRFIEGGFCAWYEGGWPIDINHFYPSTGCDIQVIGNIHKAEGGE